MPETKNQPPTSDDNEKFRTELLSMIEDMHPISERTLHIHHALRMQDRRNRALDNEKNPTIRAAIVHKYDLYARSNPEAHQEATAWRQEAFQRMAAVARAQTYQQIGDAALRPSTYD